MLATKIDDIYYFFDYNYGLWQTKDFITATLVDISGFRQGGSDLEYGGSSYYITKDQKYLYIATDRMEIGYYVIDFEARRVLYQLHLPDFKYGSGAHIYVPESNEEILYVEIHESDEAPNVVYLSKDRGKSFEKIAENVLDASSAFIIDEDFYYFDISYIDSEAVCNLMKYSFDDGSISQMDTTMGIANTKVFGDFIVQADGSSTVKIYDKITFSLIDCIETEAGTGGVSGMDIIDDYLVISGENIIVLQMVDN